MHCVIDSTVMCINKKLIEHVARVKSLKTVTTVNVLITAPKKLILIGTFIGAKNKFSQLSGADIRVALSK